ncbi:MAG: hypothetical protein K0R29_2014 [Pseudobdellovibrio sp.]|jgi:hypothetical protein|nr:hypothetical protein [Pseudobdellovibrio sp.]
MEGNVKTLNFIVSVVCAIAGFNANAAKNGRAPFEIKIGIMDKFITGRDGNIIGILLQDDTRVQIPPHMGDQLLKVVKRDDIVTVKGYRQSAKLIAADTVVNTATAESADEVDHTEAEMARKVSERPGGL